jgi:hypothetical protein
MPVTPCPRHSAGPQQYAICVQGINRVPGWQGRHPPWQYAPVPFLQTASAFAPDALVAINEGTVWQFLRSEFGADHSPELQVLVDSHMFSIPDQHMSESWLVNTYPGTPPGACGCRDQCTRDPAEANSALCPHPCMRHPCGCSKHAATVSPHATVVTLLCYAGLLAFEHPLLPIIPFSTLPWVVANSAEHGPAVPLRHGGRSHWRILRVYCTNGQHINALFGEPRDDGRCCAYSEIKSHRNNNTETTDE